MTRSFLLPLQQEVLLLVTLIIIARSKRANAWFGRSNRRAVVRVVFLVGDDNAQGYASIQHLKELCTTTTTPTEEAVATTYEPYCQSSSSSTEKKKNTDSSNTNTNDKKKGRSFWKTVPDVTVVYDYERGQDMIHGPLSVNGQWGATPFMFGPEVAIGMALKDAWLSSAGATAAAAADHVVIIKAGWSGRSLGRDFCAPNIRTGAGGGFQWFRMLQDWKYVQHNLRDILLGKKNEFKHARLVVSGIIWWHGYTDLNDNHFSVKQYARDLENWLMAIRMHLGMFVPIVVAELGGQGVTDVSANELDFREMQQSVVQLPQFSANTFYVPTAHHVTSTVSPFYDDATTEFNQQHYYRRADTMIAIGYDLGRALVMKQQTHDASPSHSAATVLVTIVCSMMVTAVGCVQFRRAQTAYYNTSSNDNENDEDDEFESVVQLQQQKRKRYRDQDEER